MVKYIEINNNGKVIKYENKFMSANKLSNISASVVQKNIIAGIKEYFIINSP